MDEQIEDFLHVCGGVSGTKLSDWAQRKFSPRMWRCFGDQADELLADLIFSTYVEVFLWPLGLRPANMNFLHVCGGVSPPVERVVAVTEFSPRMWRCFC